MSDYRVAYRAAIGSSPDNSTYWQNLFVEVFSSRCKAEDTLANLAKQPHFRGGKIIEIRDDDD